jgi:hypothetical protein
MQNATHLVCGILIETAAGRVRDARLRRLLVPSLGILSHGILDRLARMTYHPPGAQPGDRFWVAYHAAMYSASALLAVTNGISYRQGMFWAAAPDLDWGARPLSRRLPPGLWPWKGPILHGALHKLIDALPGLRRLNHLPDWRSKRGGVLVELVLIAALAMAIQWIEECSIGG